MKVENGKLIEVYNSDVVNGTVAIPNGIKEIGIRAFQNCDLLEAVIIPYGVEIIRDHAFTDCCNLKKVSLPSTVEYIGPYAFSLCVSLDEINIPDAVRSIMSGVFLCCRSLKHIDLPKGVILIQDHAFQCCTSLTEVNICADADIESIADNAFDDFSVIKRKDENNMINEEIKKVSLEGYVEFGDDESITTCIKAVEIDYEQRCVMSVSENETIINITSSTDDNLTITIKTNDIEADEILLTNSEGNLRRYQLVEVNE